MLLLVLVWVDAAVQCATKLAGEHAGGGQLTLNQGGEGGVYGLDAPGANHLRHICGAHPEEIRSGSRV